jgi:hypothetical protein
MSLKSGLCSETLLRIGFYHEDEASYSETSLKFPSNHTQSHPIKWKFSKAGKVHIK